MTDTFTRIGDEAAKVRDRVAEMKSPAVPDNVIPFDTHRKARLAELAHEVGTRIAENRQRNKEIKAFMDEMQRLSPNYAAEFVRTLYQGDGGAA